jgi:DNA adenine methylase
LTPLVKPKRILKSKNDKVALETQVPRNELVEVPQEALGLTNITKPFLKWVGGKTQIIDKVLHHFPKEMHSYHEPFLGGGSILLALLSQVKSKKIKLNPSGKIYASDLNSNLIGLYQAIQSDLDTFLAEMKVLSDTYDSIKGTEVNREASSAEEALTSQESYYYWIRRRFNSLRKKKSPLCSALFLFMNKTCFRGVYREGPNGFNVPFGHYKNPGFLDETHLRQVSTLIKDVVFTCQPFAAAMEKVQPGDFIYLDPPYAPENEKSFVTYNADGFDLAQHQQLFKLTKDVCLLGAKMLMSNADVSLVKNAFPAPVFQTEIVSCRRAINSKDPAAKANEVLIRN